MLESLPQLNPALLIIIAAGLIFLAFNSVSKFHAKQDPEESDSDNKSYQEVLQPLVQSWVERNDPSLGEISSVENGLAYTMDLLSELSKMDDPPSGSEYAFDQLYDGKSQEAINLLSHLISEKLNTGSPEDIKDAAEYSRSLGNLLMLTNATEAVKAYQQAVKLNPKDLRSLCILGRFFQKKENFEEAEKIFTTILRTAEKSDQKDYQSFAWGNLGAIFWYQEEFQKAEDAYKQSKSINEVSGNKNELIEDYFSLGRLQLSKENLTEAKDYFETALSLSHELDMVEGRHEIHTLLAHVLQLTGNLNEAQEHLEKAMSIAGQLEDEPMKASAYSGLGVISFTRGKLKESEEYHQRAIQIFKKSSEPIGIAQETISLGFTQLEKKEYSNALDGAQFALELGKKHNDENILAGAYALLGSTYQEMKNFKEAEENLLHSLGLLGKSQSNEDYLALIYGNLGWFYVETRDFDKAIHYIELSMEICQRMGLKITLAHQHDNMGRVFYQQGRQEDGIQSLKTALKLFKEIGADLEIDKIQAKLTEWEAPETEKKNSGRDFSVRKRPPE